MKGSKRRKSPGIASVTVGNVAVQPQGVAVTSFWRPVCTVSNKAKLISHDLLPVLLQLLYNNVEETL